MQYDPSKMSFGCELEFADVLVGQPLPEGCAWNHLDNTIVNSNGIANDPKGEIWPYGGEINTRPTNTVDEQVEIIREIIDMLDPKAVINYRCNLHIHVRIPGLSEDLESCKKLLRYIDTYGQEAFDIIERIPKPDPSQMSKEAFDGAMKRYKRRHRSHQYQMPKARVDEMLAATTTKEFFEGHAPLTEDGRRMWYFSPRAAINLRQMWETTNTIEFRHFPGTLDIHEYRSCINWCRLFLLNVLRWLEPMTPRELYEFHKERYNFKFPEFAEYNHDLEKGYALTNFEHNSRKEVAARIAFFKEHGTLEGCP